MNAKSLTLKNPQNGVKYSLPPYRSQYLTSNVISVFCVHHMIWKGLSRSRGLIRLKARLMCGRHPRCEHVFLSLAPPQQKNKGI